MNTPQTAKSILRAVPPVALPQTPSPEPTVSALVPAANRKRWLLGLIIGGIALLGAIPLPDSIRGEGTISSPPGSRQTITTASAGWVTTAVKKGDRVQSGQVVATITSEDLKQSFVQAETQKQQAQTQVELARQSLLPLMAKVEEAKSRVAAIRQQAAFLQAKRERLDSGTLPEIRQIASEEASLKSQIASLQEQQRIVSERLQRYENVKEEGAISLNEIDAQRSQQISLAGQIQTLQHQLDSKAVAIEKLRTELQQQWQQQNADMNQAIAALDTQYNNVQEAQATIATHNATAHKRMGEVSRQQERQQQESALKAALNGMIVDAKLDPHHPQYFAAGNSVLEIVDLSQLVATIQIHPEDRELIQIDDRARICPRRTSDCYDGRVKDIDSIARLNEQKTAASVDVRIQILDAPSDMLHLGLPVDASMAVRSTSLYEKLKREIDKLVSPRRFV